MERSGILGKRSMDERVPSGDDRFFAGTVMKIVMPTAGLHYASARRKNSGGRAKRTLRSG
jgi:hypothetical protein